MDCLMNEVRDGCTTEEMEFLIDRLHD
jgi:hypothetical protein